MGRVGAGRYRSYLFDHIGYFVCIGDDYFIRLFGFEIVKFREHFFGSSHVERYVPVRIGILLPCEKYMTEYFIARLVEVYIACCDYRYTEFVAELYYSLVYIYERLPAGYRAVVNHELIVSERLYFKIVVELCHFNKLAVRSSRENCLIQLSRFARRADYQTVPVLLEHGLGYSGKAVVVVEIRERNELVQIFKPCLILYEDYLMIRLYLFGITASAHVVSELINRFDAFRHELLAELSVYKCEHMSVFKRPVVIEVSEVKILCECVEVVL